MNHLAVLAVQRLARAIGQAGPESIAPTKVAGLVTPILDLAIPLMRTRVINLPVTSGAGSSDIVMSLEQEERAAWEVFALFAERTGGDNTFDNFYVQDPESNGDPMVIDEFTNQTTRVYSANKGPMNMWLYPRDAVGIKMSGAGVATTTIRIRLWVRRWLWNSD